MSQFSTAKAFADYTVTQLGGRGYVRSTNQKNDLKRIASVAGDVLRLVKYGVDDFGLEYGYYAAAYGLSWAVETGRLDGRIVMALRAMNTRELLHFIHDIRMHCGVIADVPRYIIQWHFGQQAA